MKTSKTITKTSRGGIQSIRMMKNTNNTLRIDTIANRGNTITSKSDVSLMRAIIRSISTIRKKFDTNKANWVDKIKRECKMNIMFVK
jgi:hypothetical protein